MTDNDIKPKSQHREYDALDHEPSPRFRASVLASTELLYAA